MLFFCFYVCVALDCTMFLFTVFVWLVAYGPPVIIISFGHHVIHLAHCPCFLKSAVDPCRFVGLKQTAPITAQMLAGWSTHLPSYLNPNSFRSTEKYTFTCQSKNEMIHPFCCYIPCFLCCFCSEIRVNLCAFLCCSNIFIFWRNKCFLWHTSLPLFQKLPKV